MPWHIYQSCTEWRWERVGTRSRIIARSDHGFDTREACEADARLHGYRGEHAGPIDQGDMPASVV